MGSLFIEYRLLAIGGMKLATVAELMVSLGLMGFWREATPKKTQRWKRGGRKRG